MWRAAKRTTISMALRTVFKPRIMGRSVDNCVEGGGEVLKNFIKL